MLSFVIPAHNEAALLGGTVQALHAAARALDLASEVIVVDDASTDATADIARSMGATVVPVSLRKIAAVRNAGARVAQGDVLVFVDADTNVPADVLRAMMRVLEQGAVGGGARQKLDAAAPWWSRGHWLLAWYLYLVRLTGGCFLFVRRDVFEAAGGFDESYYAGEEIHLARSLKARGRFVVVRDTVITSGRKFHTFGARGTAREMMHAARNLLRWGLDAYRRPETAGFWYRAQR